MSSESPTEQSNERKRFSPKKMVALTAALAVLATAGCGKEAQKKDQSKSSGSTASLTAKPSPRPTTSPEITAPPSANAAETIPTVASLEINDSMLDKPKVLLKTFNERLTEWYNAGSTHENALAAMQSAMHSGETIDDFASKLAARYDKVFMDALVAKGWESNDQMTTWVNNMTRIHRETLSNYILTSFPEDNPLDKQPYRRGSEFTKIDSILDQASGSITVVVTQHDYDNADQNRVGEALTGGEKAAGENDTGTETFIDVDGKVKLSDIILQHLLVTN